MTLESRFFDDDGAQDCVCVCARTTRQVIDATFSLLLLLLRERIVQVRKD